MKKLEVFSVVIIATVVLLAFLLPVVPDNFLRTALPAALLLASGTLIALYPNPTKDKQVLSRAYCIIGGLLIITFSVLPLFWGKMAHQMVAFAGAPVYEILATVLAMAGSMFILIKANRDLHSGLDSAKGEVKTLTASVEAAQNEKAEAETNAQEAAERESEERTAKESAQDDLKKAVKREEDLQKQIDKLNTDLQESKEEVALYLSENNKLEKRVAALTQTQSQQEGGPASDTADTGASQFEIIVKAEPTEKVVPENSDAVVIPAVAAPVEEKEDAVDGAVVFTKDPSGHTVIKESAMPQTAVYLHKIAEDDEEVSFEVCCTDEVDSPLCVGVLSTRNGKKDKEMYFRIPAGSKKSKRLIRVPRGANIGLAVMEHLHLNPSRQVLNALSITADTQLPPYRVQGYQSSTQPAEVFVVDAA